MGLTFANPSLHLRHIYANDEENLFQIYSSTRTEELAQVTNWTSAQKETFLRSQFKAQHSYYQNNYRGADFWIITYGAQVIGRLYLHPNFEGISMRIIDISLLPAWRNQSLGKQILLSVMEYARGMSRSITIHVENFNPAMKLYKRLGFVLVSETNGVYHLLEWRPDAQASQENNIYNQPVTNGSRTTMFSSL